jgi:hypothetical protein
MGAPDSYREISASRPCMSGGLQEQRCWQKKDTGYGAVRLAHLLWEQGVVGSNPTTPTVCNKIENISVNNHLERWVSG